MNTPKLPTNEAEWDKLRDEMAKEFSRIQPHDKDPRSINDYYVELYDDFLVGWNARHKLAEQERRILLDSKLEQIRIHKINTEQWQAALDTANALLREAEGVLENARHVHPNNFFADAAIVLAKLKAHLGHK